MVTEKRASEVSSRLCPIFAFGGDEYCSEVARASVSVKVTAAYDEEKSEDDGAFPLCPTHAF